MTEETLIASARLLVRVCVLRDLLLIQGSHNRFPPDTAFPQIEQLSDGIEELCAIIAKYNAQSQFRLRLLHRHMTIPEGQIMLGTRITKPLGFWTRPARISDIDLRKIYGHIFSVDAARYTSEGEMRNALLFPSEFREGPPVSFGNIDGNFFTEFTDCLRTKGLENVFGLEVVQDQLGKMIEFSFDIGSLLLKEEEVNAEVRGEGKGQFKLQETGWSVMIEDETVYKTGETRCATFATGHVKVTDSKAKGVLDVVKILRDDGVLAT